MLQASKDRVEPGQVYQVSGRLLLVEALTLRHGWNRSRTPTHARCRPVTPDGADTYRPTTWVRLDRLGTRALPLLRRSDWPRCECGAVVACTSAGLWASRHTCDPCGRSWLVPRPGAVWSEELGRYVRAATKP